MWHAREVSYGAYGMLWMWDLGILDVEDLEC